MNETQAGFRYPLLGFTTDGEIWRFEDWNTLTSCGPRTLKKNLAIEMELIDAKGRRWGVRSVRRTGRAEPLWLWLISHLVSTPQSRIEYELDELSPVTLDEVKARTCAAVEATSSDYCNDDEHEEVLVPLLAKIRSAKTFGSVHKPLGLDSFMAY